MSRAQRSLVTLTGLTVLSTGLLAQALSGPAGVPADLQVTASAILLLVSAGLLVRVLRHLTRSPRRPDATQTADRPGDQPATGGRR